MDRIDAVYGSAMEMLARRFVEKHWGVRWMLFQGCAMWYGSGGLPQRGEMRG